MVRRDREIMRIEGSSRQRVAGLAFDGVDIGVDLTRCWTEPNKGGPVARTDISWAGRLDEATGGAGGFALGAPDAQSAGLSDGQAATFSGWARASYEGLAELLGGAITGDVVAAEMLESADVIAFEMNGSSPAFSGGWESCDFEFRDSQGSVVVHWKDGTVGGAFLGTPLPRDPHVVANGSITGAAYGAFFGIPAALVTKDQPTLSPEQIVVSFLLFRVRGEIDVTGPAFRLTLRNVPQGPETPTFVPDPDAIGVLRHAPALPARPVKPKKSAARRVFDLCRSIGVEEAILPAMAAVWDRRASGQPSRNEFESTIYAAFDSLSQEQQDALGRAFAGYRVFRANGTDTCLFVDRLAAVVPNRPLEPAEFLAEFIGEGAAVAAQQFFKNSGGVLGPGLVRPWRQAIDPGPDPTGPALGPLGPWPWITAVRPDMSSIAEYGNTESFRPRGETYVPQEHQFDKVCALRPEPDGTVNYRCDRVHPPGPPAGPTGGFTGTGTCTGGPLYTFGNDCLIFPARSAGASVALRGFNFFTPSVKVHLQSRDDPQFPPVVQECVVYGDRVTPLRDDHGDVIANQSVKDFVDVPIPAERPDQPGTSFPPGLYDIWVSVVDTSDPAGAVERESNRLILRIEPNPNIKFTLASPGGRCVTTTSGPGNDEIWWDAFVGHFVPANMPITPERKELKLEALDRKSFSRPAWDGMEDGKEVSTGPTIWGPDVFKLHGVVCVCVVGFEVDSEEAAREQLQGFWDAFGKALLAVVGTAIGLTGASSSFIDRALKAGVSIKVSIAAMAIGAAVIAAVILISCAFWAAWAPADLIALDIFTLDALTAADHTNPKKPLPADSVRSFGESLITHEFPKDKAGSSGASTCTWKQQNEYTSSDEESHYVLNFTLDGSLQVPP
jgi:hypothetical protein